MFIFTRRCPDPGCQHSAPLIREWRLAYHGKPAKARFAVRNGLQKQLLGRMAALRGARSLAYSIDLSRSLCFVRLALRPLAAVFQSFLRLISTISDTPIASPAITATLKNQ